MGAPDVIRPATPADYDHFLVFLAELGLPDDPVPDRARWEAEMRSATFFLERDGAPVGYAVLRILPGLAHVFHVVTHPAHRGGGVGRALMEELAGRARAAGRSRWGLNVRIDNGPAIRLYERSGMKALYRSAAMRIAWAKVAGLPRAAGSFSTRLVDPAEDAALEGAFPIAAGRLADLRRTPGRVVLRLVDAERPGDPRLGVACFDPAFPGASPFHVSHPGPAAPLLDGIRAHARPGDVHVRLTVESHDALAAALTAAGAEVMLDMLHMEGDLG